MKRVQFVTTAAGAAAMFALGLTAVGCSNGGSGTRNPNHPPVMEITGGPVEQSDASFSARVLWRGWDDDGIILHYEYALDPPDAFTATEIASPEKSPGVSIRVIPGPSVGTDTLRVSKTVAGLVESFDWIQTVEFSRSFAFQTPNPDSGYGTGTKYGPLARFSGVHTIYMRCLDNEGAYSPLSRLSFTAQTVTPTAKVESPDISAEILIVGTTLSLRWSGYDPDGTSADKKPTGYIYRLLRLDTLDPPIPIVGVHDTSLLYRIPGEWTYVNGDTTSLLLQLIPDGTYLCGIRAVDEAGGIEPFCDLGRNGFKLLASSSGGKPVLTVSEPSVGRFSFRGITPECPEVEVATGARLRFTWSATAQEYGGRIDAYSWGLDIADLDREGPQSGWTTWGTTTGNQTPISFPLPGIHVLYVRVRDVAGAITLGCITLRVIEFQYDREVLYVDDFPDKTTPRPSQHTDFWRGLFQNYADNSDWDVSAFNEFHVWGAADDQFVPTQLTLSEMGRYKLLVWETLGTGVGSVTSLVQSATLTPKLGGYLQAGGKLWVSGNATVMAMTTSPNGLTGDPAYPKTSISSGQFIYDFLKIHATKIDNDKGSNNRNTLMGAWPFPTPGKPALYDTLMVDPDKLSPIALGAGRGVSYGDVITDPMFVESEPGFRGNVDSLYVYRAAGPIFGTGSSTYDRRLNAVRWSDLDPDRLQGRVQWFGFSMYWMFDSQAASVFKKSVDWFREEQIPEAE